MAVLPGLAVGLTLNSAAFLTEVQRVNQSVSRLGQSVDQQNAIMTRGAGAVTGAINVLKGAVVGLISGLSVGALTNFGKAALDSAGNLGELSKAAGVTTKDLQALTVAGVRAGISQEQIATGLGLFARNIGEAAAGVGDFRETVERYGIALRDADGSLRSSADLLADYADLVKNAGSEQEKLSLLQDAFGRSGRQFINILGEGSAGIREFTAEAQAAGLILSQDLIERADAASDAIATLQFAVGRGFEVGVIEAFGASVTDTVGNLRLARDAGAALGTAVGTSMRAAAEAVSFAAQNFNELAAAVAAFVAFKTVSLFTAGAAAILSFASALRAAAVAQGALNALLLLNPLTALAALVAAAAAALVLFRDRTLEIGGVTLSVGQIATVAWTATTEAILGTLAAVANLATALGELITLDFAGVADAWRAAMEGFERAAAAPQTALEELRRAASADIFQQFANSVGFLEDAAESGSERLGGLSKALRDAMADARAEQSQLKALRDAYLGVGASVEQVQAATEIDNKLRQAKITLLEAEQSGLLETLRANQRLEQQTKALAEAQSVNQQGAGIQAQIDARGRETEELRIQLAIMEARNKFGAAYTTELEREIVATERLRTSLTQVQAARDLGDTLQQQRLLIRFGGEETEEYRVQIRLLQLKAQGVDAVAAGLEDEVRLLESQQTVLSDLAERRQLFTDAFKNAGAEIQRTFVGTFETIFSGGVKTFGDLFSEIKAIAIRTAAEMAALFVFRPQVALGGLQGLLQGGGGAAATFGGLASAGAAGSGAQVAQIAQAVAGAIPAPVAAPAATIPSILSNPVVTAASFTAPIPVTAAAPLAVTTAAPLAVTAPEFTTFAATPSLFSRLTSTVNDFGAKIGFATPFKQPTLPGAQPGDIAGFQPPQEGALVGTNATLSQTLGAGAIGVVGGSIVGGLFKGQGAAGGAVGGGLGAAAGFALGGPVGSLIGGGLGSLLGGAIGGLFGGGNQENQGSLRFQSTAGGAFDRGPFGGIQIQGENSFQAPLRELVTNFDKRVAEFLTAYQEDLASAAVQALDQFDKREPEADPSRGFAEILRERATAILEAAFSDLDFSTVFVGVTGVEDVANRVEQVLETIQTYGELIGTTSPAIEAAGNRLSDLEAQFAAIRAGAEALGLSLAELDAAEQEAIAQLRADAARSVKDLIDFGFLTTGAQEVRAELEALEEQFAVARAGAEELGISIEGLDRAERDAIATLRRGVRSDVSDLIDFGTTETAGSQLRAELDALDQMFANAAASARELGISTKGLARAQKEAVDAVRQSVKSDVSNLIKFGTTETAGSQLQAELATLDQMFDDAASAAKELGISVEGLAAAQRRAESELRQGARAQIGDYLTSVQGSDSQAVLNFNSAIADMRTQLAAMVSLARQLDLPLDKIKQIISAGSQSIGRFRTETVEGLQAMATASEQGTLTGPARAFRAEQDAIKAQFAEAIDLAKSFGKPILTGRLQAGRDRALAENRADELRSINELIASAGDFDPGIVGQFRASLRGIETEFQAAREVLTEMGVSRAALNAAEQRAIAGLKEQAKLQVDQLIASAANSGAAADAGAAFRNELKRVRDAFSEARQVSSALGLSVTELNAAESRAIGNLRDAAHRQIGDILASVESGSGAGAQFRAEMQRIQDSFAEARALASALGRSVDDLNAAQGRAVANLREEARAQINATIATGNRTTGPGQALVDELRSIEEAFADARVLARELGDSLTALNAAEGRALETARERGRIQIAELIQTGQLNGAGARYAQELARIRAEFADGRALARALGMDVSALNDAQGRAISALKDEVRARAALLSEDTSGAAGQLVVDLRELNNEFAEVIAGAAALEITIGDLAAAQERAAEKLRQAALSQAEDRTLAASRQFDALLSPLREFQAELKFSVGSPVEQFRLAREEFERIAALAKGGDLSAIAAIPQAGRLFLEQATSFGASPGRVDAEQQIQAALTGVIDATVRAQQEATKGVEDAIRRASDREVDTLDELKAEVREVVRELQRVRDAVGRSRTA